ncbi:hypothetical protein Mapa_003992 [Marchantia paleacea]|nr:hypothetical protein Mapa_003992 [Marchantia paleacea]
MTCDSKLEIHFSVVKRYHRISVPLINLCRKVGSASFKMEKILQWLTVADFGFLELYTVPASILLLFIK